MLSMTLVGFASNPILAKVTLLEKQTQNPPKWLDFVKI